MAEKTSGLNIADAGTQFTPLPISVVVFNNRGAVIKPSE